MKKAFNRATDTFKELILYYLIVIFTSGLIFHWFEGKKLIDSIWWAFVTAMTVGYGDFYPITLGGRIDAVILMHIVPLILVPLLIVRMVTDLLEDKDKFTDIEQKQLMSDISEIKKQLQIKNF